MSQIGVAIRPVGMSLRAKQVVVAVLALSAAFVGGWAAIAPHSFFTSFPLPGHHWVAAEPPYTEHLVRDVGGLYLALLVVSVWGLVRPRHETFVMSGLAWELFSVPHLIFHSAHLYGLSTFDAAGNVISLGGTVVLAGLLLFPGRPVVLPAEAAA
jgi:hypothetical protein